MTKPKVKGLEDGPITVSEEEVQGCFLLCLQICSIAQLAGAVEYTHCTSTEE